MYRARDHSTARIVALKVLQAHHLEVPDLVQRFRSEVRAVTSLDHPHVLPIHEVGEHDGIPFFSMKLTTGGRYGIALADNNTIAMWPILIWADGGDVVTDKNCSALGDAATVAAVKSWADLVKQGISPVGLSGQAADNLVAAGKAAMEINGPWATGAYTAAKINYAVAPVPVGSSGQPVTLASTVPMILNSRSKHRDAALTFLAWWNGRTAQEGLAGGVGYPPSRTDMADDAALKSNPFVPKFAAQTEHARLWLGNLADFQKIDTNIFQPAIQKITRGADAASTLQEASKSLNDELGCHS